MVPSTETGKNGGGTGVLLLYSEGANGSGVYFFKKLLIYIGVQPINSIVRVAGAQPEWMNKPTTMQNRDYIHVRRALSNGNPTITQPCIAQSIFLW